MARLPCANLRTAEPSCHLGRRVPQDCGGCAAYRPAHDDADRTRCEVWTRVMGYHRPVSAFNAGKRAEHQERMCFKERHDEAR